MQNAKKVVSLLCGSTAIRKRNVTDVLFNNLNVFMQVVNRMAKASGMKVTLVKSDVVPAMGAKVEEVGELQPASEVKAVKNGAKMDADAKGKGAECALTADAEVCDVASRERQVPTIEEMKNRATIVHLLQAKHTALVEKLNSLERFDVEHDAENVTATIRDAKGLTFTSASAKTIRLVVDSWRADFRDAIAETELKLKEAFNW